jgi:hypothetical protein
MITLKQLKSKLEKDFGWENLKSDDNKWFVDNLLKDTIQAIEVIRCCKSDSELLPDVEKKQLIEDAYWLNLQNLSGREDFEEAFKLGIETGVDETLKKLHS